MATGIDLHLEVAWLDADSSGEFRGDPPSEVLEPVLGFIPGREHTRPQPLDVTVGVAGNRTDRSGAVFTITLPVPAQPLSLQGDAA